MLGKSPLKIIEIYFSKDILKLIFRAFLTIFILNVEDLRKKRNGREITVESNRNLFFWEYS